MNAYRGIKFTTPAQNAAYIVGILVMEAAILAMFIIFG